MIPLRNNEIRRVDTGGDLRLSARDLHKSIVVSITAHARVPCILFDTRNNAR